MYSLFFFFFNDTATTEIYTLSLHDALPISSASSVRTKVILLAAISSRAMESGLRETDATWGGTMAPRDRKSTRLNSSHANISYAVFCLKKKKQIDSKQSQQ